MCAYPGPRKPIGASGINLPFIIRSLLLINLLLGKLILKQPKEIEFCAKVIPVFFSYFLDHPMSVLKGNVFPREFNVRLINFKCVSCK